MSEGKILNDFIGSLPTSSITSGKQMMMVNGNSLERVSSACFARTVTMQFTSADEYIRIRNITSVLVACRANVGYRSALVWFSGYGLGGTIRIQNKCIFNSSYSWWVNGGAANDNASVYVKPNGELNSDIVAVTSLFGEMPILEKVTALPSGAVTVSFA